MRLFSFPGNFPFLSSAILASPLRFISTTEPATVFFLCGYYLWKATHPPNSPNMKYTSNFRPKQFGNNSSAQTQSILAWNWRTAPDQQKGATNLHLNWLFLGFDSDAFTFAHTHAQSETNSVGELEPIVPELLSSTTPTPTGRQTCRRELNTVSNHCLE